MVIVYTGISHKDYHGRDLLQLIAKGLPVGAYAATSPYIAEYYMKTHYPKDGLIISFDIPGVMRYAEVTDVYKNKFIHRAGGMSIKLIGRPPKQTFVAIGSSAADFD